jgi:hypothetical protein
MTKKPYTKPVVTRVRLDLKTSVLAVCSLSTSISPDGNPATCKISGCRFPVA